MYFIGDVHGEFDKYKKIIEKIPNSIQVGDLGLGFFQKSDKQYKDLIKANPEHKFIRGNHDNPNVCQEMQTYLGNFGYLNKKDIFFFSGAYSIDKNCRVEGLSWWKNEELNLDQFKKALELYVENKPEIVVSHDCPQSIFLHLFYENDSSQTRRFLDLLFFEHKPKIWIFGHHHISKKILSNKTEFICLKSLETIKI